MGDAAVKQILDKIKMLSDDERLCLTERLAEIADAEWKQEAEEARRIARQKGIDQAEIDRAVRDARHGR